MWEIFQSSTKKKCQGRQRTIIGQTRSHRKDGKKASKPRLHEKPVNLASDKNVFSGTLE